MSWSNKEADWVLGASLATTVTSSALDLRDVASGAFQLAWTGASATDATFKLQYSVNGSDWEDVTSGSQTISAAAGAKIFRIDIANVPLWRYVFTKVSETTGTYSVRYYFRGSK